MTIVCSQDMIAGSSSLVRPGRLVDRVDEPAVDGVDVAVGVEQQMGGRDRGVQRPVEVRRLLPRVGEQPPDPGQFPGYRRAEGGRLGEPQAPVIAPRAQLRRAEQRGHRVGGLTAAQLLTGRPAPAGRPFPRPVRGPRWPGARPAARVVRQAGRPGPGGPGAASAIADSSTTADRISGWRKASRPVPSSTWTRPACSAGARSSISRGPAVCGLQDGQVSAAFQRGEQEQVAGGSGQVRCPGVEQGLQAGG